MDDRNLERRKVLRNVGGSGIVLLAGCLGFGSNGDEEASDRSDSAESGTGETYAVDGEFPVDIQGDFDARYWDPDRVEEARRHIREEVYQKLYYPFGPNLLQGDPGTEQFRSDDTTLLIAGSVPNIGTTRPIRSYRGIHENSDGVVATLRAAIDHGADNVEMETTDNGFDQVDGFISGDLVARAVVSPSAFSFVDLTGEPDPQPAEVEALTSDHTLSQIENQELTAEQPAWFEDAAALLGWPDIAYVWMDGFLQETRTAVGWQFRGNTTYMRFIVGLDEQASQSDVAELEEALTTEDYPDEVTENAELFFNRYEHLSSSTEGTCVALDWQISTEQFNLTDHSVPQPSVVLEYNELDDGVYEIEHAGGDRVAASRTTLVTQDGETTTQFYDDHTTIEIGDTVEIEASPNSSVVLNWETSTGETVMIGSVTLIDFD